MGAFSRFQWSSCTQTSYPKLRALTLSRANQHDEKIGNVHNQLSDELLSRWVQQLSTLRQLTLDIGSCCGLDEDTTKSLGTLRGFSVSWGRSNASTCSVLLSLQASSLQRAFAESAARLMRHTANAAEH